MGLGQGLGLGLGLGLDFTIHIDEIRAVVLSAVTIDSINLKFMRSHKTIFEIHPLFNDLFVIYQFSFECSLYCWEGKGGWRMGW